MVLCSQKNKGGIDFCVSRLAEYWYSSSAFVSTGSPLRQLLFVPISVRLLGGGLRTARGGLQALSSKSVATPFGSTSTCLVVASSVIR